MFCFSSCDDNSPVVGTVLSDESSNLKITVSTNSNNELVGVVTGFIEEKEDWECVIPSKYEGLRITSIGDEAFKDCTFPC